MSVVYEKAQIISSLEARIKDSEYIIETKKRDIEKCQQEINSAIDRLSILRPILNTLKEQNDD